MRAFHLIIACPAEWPPLPDRTLEYEPCIRRLGFALGNQVGLTTARLPDCPTARLPNWPTQLASRPLEDWRGAVHPNSDSGGAILHQGFGTHLVLPALRDDRTTERAPEHVEAGDELDLARAADRQHRCRSSTGTSPTSACATREPT
jgi:hypothetical protein